MVVVITGASAGIGRELARELNRHGAKLVLAARRVDRLEELNAELGGKHLCVRCDVSIEDDCRNLIDMTIEHFGRLDTLVCNAGYGVVRDSAEISRAELDAIFATNVAGTSDCVRFAVPLIRRNEKRNGLRGQIVIVSSAAARRGLVYFGAYSATKAAQLSIAEALRVELEDDAIAVTSVHPIGTESEFLSTAEAVSSTKISAPARRPIEQTPKTVAKKIAAAIRRPVRECWPYWPARWVLSLCTISPWLGDFVMRRTKRQIDAFRKRG